MTTTITNLITLQFFLLSHRSFPVRFPI
ncbi:hypothetical protein CFP56_008077 [Quercus suber]|uniref:Uncharacterized protein n=1 Tax=Quercus suber TaxID=58331 RepID=A0AAW0L6X7_QUESU